MRCENRHRRTLIPMTDHQQEDRRHVTEDDRQPTSIWFRLDVGWLADQKVEQLGQRHGSAGPLVFCALLGAAKAQEAVREPGEVEVSWRQLAFAAFLDSPDAAREVVDSAIEVGLAEIVDRHGENPSDAGNRHAASRNVTGVTLRLVGWAEKQVIRKAPMSEAERAARYRARKRHGESHDEKPPDAGEVTDGVTGRHGASRDITAVTRTSTDTGTAHTHTAGERAENDHPSPFFAESSTVQRTVTAVVEVFQSIPRSSLAFRGCPVDVFAVEQQVVRFPDGDHLAAARAAIVRASEPSHRPPNLARLLGWELENQAKPRHGRGTGRRESPSDLLQALDGGAA